MNFIKLKSRAKINLTLDVVRRRKDGYHELEMIMQTLQLYDSIYIRETDTGKIELKTNLCYLPVDEKNIAYKAAQIMMEKFNIEKGVYIQITKRIPVAAGLAGGSGNGAAVLKGMKELFGINISTEELMKIGEELGSDVPYCIMEGTAFATGRGEILKRLSPMANAYVVLAKPEAWVSTAFVYNNLNIPDINKHPDTKK
ncbi:MAG: 4-(cytidine 5'-diphospho)-2-C-methyl-D-erythritol kinase, partial [Anaerotignaceae bacterium]